MDKINYQNFKKDILKIKELANKYGYGYSESLYEMIEEIYKRENISYNVNKTCNTCKYWQESLFKENFECKKHTVDYDGVELSVHCDPNFYCSDWNQK